MYDWLAPDELAILDFAKLSPHATKELMKSQLTIQVEGTPPRTTTHAGQRYAGLELGQRYKLTVSNATGGKILAVVTVDGKNVVNGEPGSASGAGMIIGPYSSTTFDGWRTNTETVAAFRLTEHGQSYAASDGDTSNVGVIGCAEFEEKRKPVMRSADYGVYLGGQMRSMSMDAQPARAAVKSAGTGFGETHQSHVTTATFERATSHPVEVHTLRYDDVNNLIALGILPAIEQSPPNPFPADAPAFCKPPTISFEVGK